MLPPSWVLIMSYLYVHHDAHITLGQDAVFEMTWYMYTVLIDVSAQLVIWQPTFSSVTCSRVARKFSCTQQTTARRRLECIPREYQTATLCTDSASWSKIKRTLWQWQIMVAKKCDTQPPKKRTEKEPDGFTFAHFRVWRLGYAAAPKRLLSPRRCSSKEAKPVCGRWA